ncbi:MAG TPA: class I SAM-dependent methyltransferase [Streptosporangiaceae bacterium]|jgi:SAM-dependent methyltransferase
MTTTAHTFDPAKAEAFAGRLMPLLAGGIQSQLIDLGDRTGLFAAAAEGPATSDELADRADLVERYVREWLGAMVTTGIMQYDPADATYALPPEHAALLVGPASMAPVARANTVLARHVADLARVFREGGGIPYADYSPDFTDAMDGMSRGGFDQFLLEAYLPMAPGLADRLAAGARAADVACGSGHALVILARAFPRSVFTGYDSDEHALGRARKEAADEGLTNLSFELADIGHLDVTEPFDAIFMFDALHDQVDPAGVLSRISASLAPDGVFLLREPHAADRLEDRIGNPMAAVQYSVSVMHCLTVSLAHAGAGIGLAFGEGHARRLLTEAGFADPQLYPAPGQPFDVVYLTRRAGR